MTALAEDAVRSTGPAWTRACRYDSLTAERGVAVLIGGRQIALYRLADGTVRAIGNRDPFSGANVMSRGLVGTRVGTDVVFSPMFKQAFSLETGECLDDPTEAVPWYPVRIVDGDVLVGAP
jgi:nitrite reductase (NADH) small subunit